MCDLSKFAKYHRTFPVKRDTKKKEERVKNSSRFSEERQPGEKSEQDEDDSLESGPSLFRAARYYKSIRRYNLAPRLAGLHK